MRLHDNCFKIYTLGKKLLSQVIIASNERAIWINSKSVGNNYFEYSYSVSKFLCSTFPSHPYSWRIYNYPNTAVPKQLLMFQFQIVLHFWIHTFSDLTHLMQVMTNYHLPVLSSTIPMMIRPSSANVLAIVNRMCTLLPQSALTAFTIAKVTAND